MRRLILPFGLLLLISFNAFAQHTISGRVIGENDQVLNYATVALLNPGDSLLKYFGVTNAKGTYQIKNIKKGIYLIQFSYVGMQTTYDSLDIPLASGEDIGDKQLQAAVLAEVIVEAELIPIRFNNDTLEYDVRAFKTRPGAAAEEILKQLPGVEVDNSGNIKAEGEEVVKVLVDGKEFFDDDPKVATKNLPAKALSKIQVIDRKSEEAVFSGIDDGIREKTINLKLKEDHKKGYFGEVTAGVGSKETYKLEGKLFRFTPKTQHAILGMYNNINELGFTNKDNLQFGMNNKGINEVLSGGLNLSYNPTKQDRYFMSYLGNRRVKDLIEAVHSENFLTTGTYEQDQEIKQSDIDRPHRLTFGLRHNFSKQQRLIIDGRMNTGSNDQLSQIFTHSKLAEETVNTLNNHTGNTSDEFFYWTKATFIAKFNEGKAQIKTEIGGIYDKTSNRFDWTNQTRFFDPLSDSLLQQYQTNDKDRSLFYAEPSYLQKLNPAWSASFGARIGLENSGLNRREALMNDRNEFEALNIPSFGTQQQYVSPTIIVNRVGKKSQLNLKLAVIVNQFEKLQNQLSVQKKKYRYFTPNLSYQNEYRSGRRINFRYTSSVRMPTPEQLIPIDNTINPLNIIRGNTELAPEQRHSLNTRWTLFDQFSFTSFSAILNGVYTEDKIRWSQMINDDLVRVTSPINVDNDLNFNARIEFSTPLRSLGFNLSINANENWNRSIVFINQKENINTNLTHGFNLSVQNRKNDFFAIRLSAAISLTNSRFSLAEDQNNVYYNTSYAGDLRYTPSNKWNFEAKANIVNYNAQSFDEAVSVPLLSANMSYFFWQAEKGALTLSAFDLLNQYTGFKRISETNFLMQRQWNTLTQYFMLTFNLRFR